MNEHDKLTAKDINDFCDSYEKAFQESMFIPIIERLSLEEIDNKFMEYFYEYKAIPFGLSLFFKGSNYITPLENDSIIRNYKYHFDFEENILHLKIRHHHHKKLNEMVREKKINGIPLIEMVLPTKKTLGIIPFKKRGKRNY